MAQMDYYRNKILKHAEWEFVEVFVDDGISGLSTNRRESFNRMVDFCLNGEINLVLTKSISRVARNTVDTVTIIRKLKEKGIGVYFEKEYIRTGGNPLYSRVIRLFYTVLSFICRLNLQRDIR